jgi:hypothetical protein
MEGSERKLMQGKGKANVEDANPFTDTSHATFLLSIISILKMETQRSSETAVGIGVVIIIPQTLEMRE